MRVMIKAQIDPEVGNEGMIDGSLGETVNTILSDIKPEAAYFTLEDGVRTALVVCEMNGSHELPALVEPWFLSLGAEVTVTPVMNADDLEAAGPSLASLAEKYGQ